MTDSRSTAARVKRRAEILAQAGRCGNVALTCRRYGISRTVFYRWLRRFEARGPEGLQEGSRRPHRRWRTTPLRVAAKIFFFRLGLGWGPRRIRSALEAVHGVRTSEAGVWKMLDRLGCGRRSSRLRVLDPNEERTLSAGAFPVPPPAGRRTREVLHWALDEGVGAGVVRLSPLNDSRTAASFIDAVVDIFPLRVGTVITPLQPEFEGYFHWHVLGLGLEHAYGDGPPGNPGAALWEHARLVRGGLSRLAEGALVCLDDRINRAIEAWDAGARSGLKGRAGTAGPRSR